MTRPVHDSLRIDPSGITRADPVGIMGLRVDFDLANLYLLCLVDFLKCKLYASKLKIYKFSCALLF